MHSPLGGGAAVEAGVDLVLQARVLGDHRLRLQDLLGGTARGGGAIVQLLCDGGDGVEHAGALLVGGQRARGLLGGGQRLGHADDGALRHAEPDPHSAESAHPAAT